MTIQDGLGDVLLSAYPPQSAKRLRIVVAQIAGSMLIPAPLRYVKATIICGALAALLAAGLLFLGAFHGLDVRLASFLGRPAPPSGDRGLQCFLVLLFSFGIA